MAIPPRTLSHNRQNHQSKPSSVPLWRARGYLKKQGLFAAVDAAIEALKDSNPNIWEAWNHGYILDRNSRLLKRMNLTAAQIDAMFAAASKAD